MASDDNIFRYLKFDYSSHLQTLLDRVRSRWSLTWNDFQTNSFGRVLVDLIAWSNSTLAYTLNRAANELSLPTMTLRESAVRLGSLVNYSLRNPGSATVSCEASLSTTSSRDVTVSKGTVITASTDSPVLFEVAADYTIKAGSLTPESQVAVITNSFSGVNVIQTLLVVQSGGIYADLADSSIDVYGVIAPGQSIRQYGVSGAPVYTVQEITYGAGTGRSRVVLDRVWSGTSGSISAEVYDRRITLIQGQSFLDEYTAPSTEIQNQIYPLTQSPVAQGSITVKVNGTPWSSTSLIKSGAASLAYEIKTGVTGLTYVIFGDGSFGQIPSPESLISIDYRVGGGTSGNIGQGKINTSIIGLDSIGNPVSIAITNSSGGGSGGTDAETLNEARINIPRWVLSNDRAVTAQDYEILASNYSDPSYGQVKFARAVSRVENNLLEGNLVLIYAWTTGADGSLVPLSTNLKRALEDYLKSKSVGTDVPVVVDGTSIPYPVSVRVLLSQDAQSSQDVRTAVKTAINAVVSSVSPGDEIVYSDVVSSIVAVSGVSQVEIATPSSNFLPSNNSTIVTVPDSSKEYSVTLTSLGGNVYTGQLDLYPIKPWSVRLYVDGVELSLLPDADPDWAIIVGEGVASYEVGLLANRPSAALLSFFRSADDGRIYSSNGAAWSIVDYGGSRINLKTGELVISTTASVSEVTYTIIPIASYANRNRVNLYVTYSGDSSGQTRQVLRKNLRGWISSIGVGASLFKSPVKDSAGSVILESSRSNVEWTVLLTQGVTGVTRISIGQANNGLNRIDPASNEVMDFDQIIINGLNE
jgi:hypothetical protein